VRVGESPPPATGPNAKEKIFLGVGDAHLSPEDRQRLWEEHKKQQNIPLLSKAEQDRIKWELEEKQRVFRREKEKHDREAERAAKAAAASSKKVSSEQGATELEERSSKSELSAEQIARRQEKHRRHQERRIQRRQAAAATSSAAAAAFAEAAASAEDAEEVVSSRDCEEAPQDREDEHQPAEENRAIGRWTHKPYLPAFRGSAN
jgi:hypothetical protein